MNILDEPTRKKISIRNKLFLILGCLCSLTIITMTLVRFFGVPLFGDPGALGRINHRVENQVTLVANYNKQLLENWLTDCQISLTQIANNTLTHDVLYQHQTYLQNRAQKLSLSTSDHPKSSNLEQQLGFIAQIMLADEIVLTDILSDEIILSSSPMSVGTKIKKPMVNLSDCQQNMQVDLIHSEDHRRCMITFTQVVYDPDTKQPLGVLVATGMMDKFLNRILANTQGLGKTGEVLLVNQNGILLSHVKNLLTDGGIAKPKETRINAQPAILAAAGKEKLLPHAYDYRGREVIAVTRHIKINGDNHGWGMVVKQDRSEAMQMLSGALWSMITAGLVGVIVVFVAAFIIARQLTSHLQQFSRVANRVRQGDLTTLAPVGGTSEEANLAEVFNAMVGRIKDWQHDLRVEVEQKTEQLTLSCQTLQSAERQRASIAEANELYLCNGNLQATIELLIEKTLHFTNSTIGYFFCSDDISLTESSLNIETDIILSDKYKISAGEQRQKVIDGCIHPYLRKNRDLWVSMIHNNEIVVLDNVLGPILESPNPLDKKPPIASLMLIPISMGGTNYGTIVLMGEAGTFSTTDKDGVGGYAATAAMLFHAEIRTNACKQAEDEARIQGEFLANMSHELRTPMNVVIGMSNLLLETQLNSTQQDYLHKINLSSRQLLTLINDILDISKLKSGHQIAIKYRPFEPEQIFSNVVNLLTYSLDDNLVELHVDINRNVPSQLIGDPQRLEQILSNLLNNAIKFTHCGDIILAVDVTQRNTQEVVLEFTIKDSGIGIEPQQLEQMFQPFVQADSSSTRQQGGTGLGLTISRQLCRLMGGELTAESTPGQGSTFCFSIPFETVATADDKARPLIPNADLLGMSVLVVDDNSISRSILENMLISMKFKVKAVDSGTRARAEINEAEANNSPFNLILLDSAMPTISGLEIARLIMKQHTQAPRILMVTPRQKDQQMKLAQEVGIAAFVTKPVQPSPLFNTILQVYGQSVPEQLVSNLAPQWHDVQVLLVEDHELNRQVMRGLLKKVGITVIEATNGSVAIEMVQKAPYDLVLMDIQMPVMNGLDATRAIRKLDGEAMKQLPILAMTANAFAQDRDESELAGMNAHISKPIDPAELYRELDRWLPQHKKKTSPISAKSLSNAIPITIHGVDTSAGLRYVDGDQQAYSRLIENFSRHFSDCEKQLRDELHNSQTDKALLRVHTLKSVAGTLGATALQSAAATVEYQLQHNLELDGLNQMVEQLNSLLTACAELPPINDKSINEPNSLGSGNSEELHQFLALLEPALETHQAHTCKTIADKLSTKDWPTEYTDTILQLREMIMGYQYKEALSLVRKIQENLQKESDND